MARNDVSVVSYLAGELGEFLAATTRRLAPATPAGMPHLTLLPLQATCKPDEVLVAAVAASARDVAPLAIELGQLSSFEPCSEVLYVEVPDPHGRVRWMHDRLAAFANPGGQERFPFCPHVTLAYELPAGEVAHLRPAFERAWNDYQGPRRALLEEVHVVREVGQFAWRDLGCVRFQSR